MINSAVKTEARAEELVLNKADKIKEPWETVCTQWTTCNCQCGETTLFQAEIWNNGKISTVVECAICDACGDDDAFANDVLKVR